MAPQFSYTFLGLTGLTLLAFGLGEFQPAARQFWTTLGAILEGIVFVLLGVVLYRVKWGGKVPAWVFALLPICAAFFAWRLAYRRAMGMEV